eukprot:3983409-Prymnesium_polylepis.1
MAPAGSARIVEALGINSASGRAKSPFSSWYIPLLHFNGGRLHNLTGPSAWACDLAHHFLFLLVLGALVDSDHHSCALEACRLRRERQQPDGGAPLRCDQRAAHLALRGRRQS